MKSNCAQKYLETVAAGQFDINEANICCWRNNCSFCKATTKKDGVPQIDKAGLRFAAEMPGKGSIITLLPFLFTFTGTPARAEIKALGFSSFYLLPSLTLAKV